MDTIDRNIILLSDGTGNSRSKAFKTNVWRMYEALDLDDPPREGLPRQYAFYDDGVGSSSFKIGALLGGAIGFGLARNVRDLYAFLCRTYSPGDRIYAFGFSRGAFTIRVLVGLIAHQGLVPYKGDETELDRLVRGAFRAYRRKYKLRLNYIEPLRDLRDGAIAAWARFRGKQPYAEARAANIVVEQTGGPLRIEFLGLWDTVDAYGLPVDELMRVIDAVVWPLTMRDLKLHPCVQRAVHALALDDERNTFHPRLWQEEAPAPQPPRTDGQPAGAAERISQVWFAGMHSDVGGGYADQGVSHVSLDWVAGEAEARGLRLFERVRKHQQALRDENGPINDSRRGLAGYYRYNPRRLERLLATAEIRIPKVHVSVMRRIRVGQDAYAPIVLPPKFEVVGSGDASRFGFDAAQQSAYAAGRERAFNIVWWRRVTYFSTLAATLLLLALPLVSQTSASACTSGACWLSPFIRALDGVVPAMFSPWTGWYATHPTHFVVLAGSVALGLWLGGALQRRVGDAMRRVWYAFDSLRPTTLASAPRMTQSRWLERAVQALRQHPGYATAMRLLTQCVLPGVFAAGLLYAAVVLVSILPFAMREAGGGICNESAAPRTLDDRPRSTTLDIKSLCAAAGIVLEAGGTYRIVVTLPPEGWKDLEQPADLRGVRPGDTSWLMRLATPLRREMAQPWLMPMAHIGSRGTDVYPLAPDPSMPIAPKLDLLDTQIVARSSGELFVYVNDAIGPPGLTDVFYMNNIGSAKIIVSRVAPPPPVP